jgi:nucleoside-diphosphate-sugar epimerase
MTRRGTSITLNYVLVLGISTILVTGLIMAGGSFVEDQRETVIESELRIVGNHVAANLEQVDRYVNASESGDPATAHINQTFQEDVTGSTYLIELLENGGDPQLLLTSTTGDIEVRVNLAVRTPVDDDAAASGGEVTAAYESGELVIRNA